MRKNLCYTRSSDKVKELFMNFDINKLALKGVVLRDAPCYRFKMKQPHPRNMARSPESVKREQVLLALESASMVAVM